MVPVNDDDEIPFAVGEYPPLSPMSPLARLTATFARLGKAIKPVMTKPSKH